MWNPKNMDFIEPENRMMVPRGLKSSRKGDSSKAEHWYEVQVKQEREVSVFCCSVDYYE